MRNCRFLGIMIIIICFSVFPAAVFAQEASNDLQQANQYVKKAIQFAGKEDVKSSQEQYKIFKSTWLTIEEGVKNYSNLAYHDIEDAMGQAAFSFAQQPPDVKKIKASLELLDQVNRNFISGKYPADTNVNAGSNKQTVSDLIILLNQSLAKIKVNDIDGAKADIEKFRKSWLDVEGMILTQSAKAYADTENDMVTSYTFLSASPPDVEGAKQTIQGMKVYLAPLSGKTHYTIFDAAVILLREGLEALLVIISLLGFLKKSGNADKKVWIWYGVGAGLGISVILGILVQVLFSSQAFGTNNFLIAGWTGLFAATMLLYMSYWLHSKSSLNSWQSYIRSQGTKALAAGSLWSLTILSFLAVFREGTETVLFYIGIASSISWISLIGGTTLGVASLIVIAYLILKVGMKIPIRTFFLVSSIFVFYLCFKFTGMGVHGLQLAGLLPATHTSAMPSIDLFAIYPTWESLIPQALLLLVAALIALWNMNKDHRIRKEMKGEPLNRL